MVADYGGDDCMIPNIAECIDSAYADIRAKEQEAEKGPGDTANTIASVNAKESFCDDTEDAGAATPDDWQEPQPLQGELPAVEALSEDFLPESFRALAADIAERMQVPLDFPAVVILLCLAGAVNRRALMQPKAKDTSWVVVPNLWGGIVGPPGVM